MWAGLARRSCPSHAARPPELRLTAALLGGLYLLGAAVLGFALVRRAFGTWLDTVESLLAAPVVGFVTTTWMAWALVSVQGRIRFGTVLAFGVACLVLGAVLLRPEWPSSGRDGLSFRGYRPLLFGLAVVAPVLGGFYAMRMLPRRADGIWSGASSWGDMALHATLTSSFLYADNFPPQNPTFPPEPLLYPYLPDFMTALPMALGLDYRPALIATALPLALALFGLVYALAWRMTGSSGAALAAPTLFFLSGGFGFLHFLEDWRKSAQAASEGQPLLVFLGRLTRNYCHVSDLDLWWSNLIGDVLLPQRASVFGLPVALLLFLLFARAWKEDPPALRHAEMLLPAGLLLGLMPRFHAHTFMAVGLVSGFLFLIRPRRAWIAFWVAALAGIIVFGSLMGAMFVGQQYLQNVLAYSTLDSGLAILPGAFGMVLVAPRSAKLVTSHGARFTMLLGYVFCLLAFVTMLVLWDENAQYWHIGLGYLLVGIGVGFAGTPASRSLTGSVPVSRAGMASGTADLQRDLGGAIMQSILGALLTSGYAASFSSQISSSPQADQVSEATQTQLTKSFASAAQTAEQYPQYAPQIIHAAQKSFLQGDDWAYSAGIIAIALGAVLVFFLFPKHEREDELLAQYAAQDA